MVTSSSVLHNWSYLSNFSDFFKSKHFLIFDQAKSHFEKIYSTDAEITGHAHKLDVKVLSLCGGGFSLLCECLPSPNHLGVN